MGYILIGTLFARAYFDSKRQDCPDLTKGCPVPTILCIMDQDLGDYELLDCKEINRYVLRILKEDCPRWEQCFGKYCSYNISRIG